MIHTAEPMASLVCECLRGSKVRVRLAGTRVLFSLVSFLAEQSAIPLINYRKPRTNGEAAFKDCLSVVFATEPRRGSLAAGRGRCPAIGYRLVSAALLPSIFLTVEGQPVRPDNWSFL